MRELRVTLEEQGPDGWEQLDQVRMTQRKEADEPMGRAEFTAWRSPLRAHMVFNARPDLPAHLIVAAGFRVMFSKVSAVQYAAEYPDEMRTHL